MKKLITISLLTSTLLLSATVKENNAAAIKYLQSNQPDKAYSLLQSAYDNKNYDNETLFLLGKTAIQAGEFDSAVSYYEELLRRDKGANRVRLVLASLYYKLGNLKKAKEQFQIVKASHPPKKVGDNINGYISAIDKGVLQGSQKSWSVSFNLGYMYDSNANAGPDTNSVLIYNLPFTLSNDAKENSDYALKYGLSINHLKRFDYNSRLFWQTSFATNIVNYKKINTLDSTSLYLSTGPTLKYNKYTFSLPISLNGVIIGHKDRYYSYSIGISPQINYQYLPSLSFSGTFSVSKKTYYNNHARASSNGMLSLSSRYFLTQSSFINLGGYAGRENSRTETFSNDSRGLNLGYYKAFSKFLNIYLSENYSTTNYDGTEVAYSESRLDKSNTVGINISYFINLLKTNFTINTSYTKNSSSIDMYDYKRKILGFSLAKSF
jgi:tetratricopeptide (TPR) repeat protein